MLAALTTRKTVIAAVIFGAFLGLLTIYIPFSSSFKVFLAVLVFAAILYNPLYGIVFTVVSIPLLPTTTTLLIILLTAGITFLKAFNDKKEYNYTGVEIPLTGFMISVFAAVFFGQDLSISFKTFIIYLGYFLLLPVTYFNIKNKKELHLIILLIILTAVVIGLYAIYQYSTGVETARSWIDPSRFKSISTRVYATFDNPNVLAEFLVLIIPLPFALFMYSSSTLLKTFYILFTIIMGLGLLFTYSRGGWLGLLFAAVILILLRERKLLIVFLILLLLAPLLLPSGVMERAATITDLSESSNAYRMTIWLSSVRMLKDFWWRGIGLGLPSFQKIYPNYMIQGTPAVHSHNLFLQIALELGIMGLVFFVWFIRNYYIFALKNCFCKIKEDYAKFIIPAVLAGIGGHLLHGMVDLVWYNPKITFLFWLLVGLTITTVKIFGGEKSVQTGTYNK